MSVPCTHHCRGCERHFHSLQAFDAHRETETPDGPGIGCFAPEIDEEARGRFVGFEGICEVSGAETLSGVIWELTSRRGNVRVQQRKAAA